MDRKYKVIIIGAGKGGVALLELFSEINTINVVGICDINPDAEGLFLAKKMGISTSTDCAEMIKKYQDVDEIINVSGEKNVKKILMEQKASTAEIIDGNSARIIWELIEKYKNSINEISMSQQRLEIILDTILVGVFLIRASDRKITYVNPIAAKMVGLDKEDIINRVCHKFVCPNELNECPIVDKGEVVDSAEKVLLQANGQRLPILKSAKLIKIQDQDFIVDSFMDITESKQAKTKLTKQASFLENIIKSLTHPFYVIDVETQKVILSNKSDGVGHSCHSLSHNSPEPCTGKHICPIEEVLKTKKSVVCEHEHIDEKGNITFCEVYGYPIFDDKGQISQMIEYSLDITDRKNAEKEAEKNREQYRSLFESSRDAIILLSSKGLIQKVNNAAIELFNVNNEGDLIKKSLLQISWPNVGKEEKDAERLNRIFDIVFKKGSHFFEWIFKKGQDQRFHATVLLNQIKHKKGILMQATVRDITSRKKTEIELLQLSRAIEQSTSIIAITDTDGNLTYVNPSFCKVSGYAMSEVIGKNPRILKTDAHSDIDYKKIWETILSGNTWQGDFYNKRKDGTCYWESATISPIREPNGEIRGYLKVADDITNRKESEKKLKDAMEIKSQFISMVSHELRTPLAAIKEGLSIVTDGSAGDVNSEQKEFLDLAKNNVDRLARLINSVLDFQKLSVGKMKFEMIVGDVNSAVMQAYKTMLTVAKEKQIELEINCTKNKSVVRFDKDKLIQVVVNLINNALKFTEKGKVSVLTEIKEGNFTVTVKDTGIGIEEGDLEKLFHKFEQLSTASDRKTGGTGLGLAISKEIIEFHRGSIWAESTYGQGSSFIFTIPLYQPANLMMQYAEEKIVVAKRFQQEFAAFMFKIDNIDELIKEHTQETIGLFIKDFQNRILEELRGDDAVFIQENYDIVVFLNSSKKELNQVKRRLMFAVKDFIFEKKDINPVDFSYSYAIYPENGWDPNELLSYLHNNLINEYIERCNKPIMIVDDEPQILESLKLMLEKIGYKKIFTAGDGQIALDSLENDFMSLIILDIKMPKMNGYELVGRLKENSRTKDIPLIIMSGYQVDNDELNAMVKNESIPVLGKPLSIEQLKMLLKKLL